MVSKPLSPTRPWKAPPGTRSKSPDLQHQLKENESQRTEITGYINQLSIQLHRWQLRLETLNERQKKLQTELSQICGTSGGIVLARACDRRVRSHKKSGGSFRYRRLG